MGTLSGGNQQRINIAIGLLARPVVLLLDEPSAGLDPRQRERLWEFVLGLAGGGTTVIFSTHNIAEAERYGQRLLVLADGEALFDGTSPSCMRRSTTRARATSSRRSSPSSGTEAIDAAGARVEGLMRWLFVKDLQILRRSPLVTALLVVYPVAIAVLIGFALSRGPETPRVAFLNEVPEGQPFVLAGTKFDIAGARSALCSRIDCIPVSSEQQARDMVESGDALAALILPPDLIQKLESLGSLTPSQPTVRVLVNEEDPVKARLVDDRISSLVTQANLKISKQVTRISANYLALLLRGGNFNLLGQTFNILGLKDTQRILEAVRPQLPANSPSADALDKVIRFSRLARQNLNLATPLLGSIAHPIDVQKEVVSGSPPSLDSFAISVAATVTLMFVTVLLVAGSLALEREENAFPRLTRGLVGRTALLVEKVGLGRDPVDRRHPADARRPVAVRSHRLGPLSPVRSGDRGGRRRLRRLRCGNRRCRP